MLELLKTHFGYDTFLPHQEEIIASVMAGNDGFVLLPTGGGKSLCYQLPALALPGLTLVVSPLIALMKDQVDGLRANGIPAGFINSSLTASQIERVQERVRQGGIKILYVAPERATLPEFQRFLSSLNVSLVAIDEAHCVSEWGHEFRPAYRELQDLRRSCPDAPVIALTATATRPVRDDILSQLGLRQPGVFVSSFNRPNLTYSVEPKKQSLPSLLALLEKHRGESAIIYCLSRRSTEELAGTISENGFQAEAYHAGMEAERRRATQDRFIRDEVQIVVATIAFGMGIDKPDIRLVVHYDLPKSLEGYYQETGRAGRDGMPSECVLFYTYADKVKQDYFINEIEDAAEQERARWRLDQVVKLCSLRACRRKFILEYLGEDRTEEDCGSCDVCLSPQEEFDATELAQKILSAVVRTGERFGAGHVVNVLLGAGTKQVVDRGHDKLTVFGIASDQSKNGLRDLIEDIVGEGLLESSGGQYPTLSITPKGRSFLKDRGTLVLARPIPQAETTPNATGRANYDARLFNELSGLRKRMADERGAPAYVIFGNRSLQDMARKAPRTREQFARVSGVGEAKLREFAEPFLEVIAGYVARHGKPEFQQSSRQPAAAQPAPRVAGNSLQETGRIISAGASLDEAAEARGLNINTIMGHLERLVESGVEVEWAHLLPPPERLAEIESAFEAVGDDLLRPVFDELDGEYSYEEIRLARLARRQPESQRLSTDSPKAGPAAPGAADPDSQSTLRINRYSYGAGSFFFKP